MGAVLVFELGAFHGCGVVARCGNKKRELQCLLAVLYVYAATASIAV
jgi:hypothetical protein